jgi:hypothetical protein
MNSREAIKMSVDMADFVSMSYLNDLSDAELLHRPHPQCNHLNWQIGHLVVTEHDMLSGIVANGMPALPEGFAAKYSKETGVSDDPALFSSKEELMSTYKAQRAALLSALDGMSDSQLDAATGVDYAPTVGAILALQGSHWLMHCGQWVVVRRMLGKPIVV